MHSTFIFQHLILSFDHIFVSSPAHKIYIFSCQANKLKQFVSFLKGPRVFDVTSNFWWTHIWPCCKYTV